MELADYLKVLRRRWWMLLLPLVVGVVGALGATATQAPVYTSSTRLLVSGGGGAGEQRQRANSDAEAYAQLVSTGPAVAAALEAAHANGAGAVVTGTADGKSPFIVITVTASSARAAQAVAASYVEVLPRIVKQLLLSPSSAPPKLGTLEAAGLPAVPTSPKPMRNMLIGGMLGLLLGAAAALLRENLDARLRESSELERLAGATLLGTVPKELSGEALPALTEPRSRRAEAYRQVRTTLEFTGPEGMPRSLVITSAAAGEGKSTLACNLAVVASRAGRDVVVVDADLRKPTVAENFWITAAVGLSDVLAGRCGLEETLVPVPGERVTVLPSGAVPSIPSELVGSVAMVDLIKELEQHFDLVVIDTPPVLPVSDALLIAVNTGGLVLVARLVETSRSALRRAAEAVRKVNASLLGVVGNGVVRSEEKAYGEGQGYYGRKATPAADVFPAERLESARRSPESARRSPESARRSPESARRNPESARRNPESARRNPESPRRQAEAGTPRVAGGGRHARRAAEEGATTHGPAARQPEYRPLVEPDLVVLAPEPSAPAAPGAPAAPAPPASVPSGAAPSAAVRRARLQAHQLPPHQLQPDGSRGGGAIVLPAAEQVAQPAGAAGAGPWRASVNGANGSSTSDGGQVNGANGSARGRPRFDDLFRPRQ